MNSSGHITGQCGRLLLGVSYRDPQGYRLNDIEYEGSDQHILVGMGERSTRLLDSENRNLAYPRILWHPWIRTTLLHGLAEVRTKEEAGPRGDRDIIIDHFNGKVILGAAGGRRPDSTPCIGRLFAPTTLFASGGNHLHLEPITFVTTSSRRSPSIRRCSSSDNPASRSAPTLRDPEEAHRLRAEAA